MKSLITFNIKHLLLTALLAFTCSVFLLWLKGNVAIAVTDWNQWKNENIVSCRAYFQLENTSLQHDKQPRDKNNGCSHQLAGSLCKTHNGKRRHSQRNKNDEN